MSEYVDSNTPRYIVMSASAKMPGTCWGHYGRIAVIERDLGYEGRIAMISNRARGVKKVVETWENLNIGKTDRCAYSRALRKAEEYAKRLNLNTNPD